MELHLSTWRAGSTRPDWTAAAVAGLAAGAVLMVLELFWAASMGGDGPWRLPHMVAAIILGSGWLESAAAGGYAFHAGVVAAALAVHYALGVAFGLLLGLLVSWLRLDTLLGRMEALGAVFGVLLYLLNFHLMAQIFPWFAELQGGATLTAHLVFGISAALLYWKLARRDTR
jgi:ribose/xylose/arabinose/galactoside ABC-type transport system permease subunit